MHIQQTKNTENTLNVQEKRQAQNLHKYSYSREELGTLNYY